jgi:hypothetical protein
VAVQPIVRGEKVPVEIGESIVACGLERDLDEMRLSDVAHVRGMRDAVSPGSHLCRHQFCATAVEPREHRAHIGHGHVRELTMERRRHLVLDRRAQQAACGEYAGKARHDDALDAELGGERSGMQGSAAAQRHEGKAARVAATAYGYQPNALRHLRIEHAVDAERGVAHGKPQRARDFVLDGGGRELGIQPHAAAGEIITVDVSEHQRSIGHGRVLAATAITRRTGICAGGVRADAQATTAIDPGDAAAAGADGVHIHHRHAHGIAIDHAFGTNHGDAALDERDIAARSADVARDEVVPVDRHRRGLGADDSGRRSRQEQTYGTLPRDRGSHETAARLHHLQGRGNL